MSLGRTTDPVVQRPLHHMSEDGRRHHRQHGRCRFSKPGDPMGSRWSLQLPRAPSGPHHFFARRMHREGSGVGVRQSLPATGSGPVKLYLETRRGVVATRPRFFRPQETEMRETRAETSRQSRTAEAVTSRPPPPLSAGNRAARLEDRRTKSGGRPEAREWHLACWGQDQMASGLQSVLRRNRTAFCMMLLPVAGIDWVSRLSSSPVPPRLERRPHGRARAGVEPVEGAPTTGQAISRCRAPASPKLLRLEIGEEALLTRAARRPDRGVLSCAGLRGFHSCARVPGPTRHSSRGELQFTAAMGVPAAVSASHRPAGGGELETSNPPCSSPHLGRWEKSPHSGSLPAETLRRGTACNHGEQTTQPGPSRQLRRGEISTSTQLSAVGAGSEPLLVGRYPFPRCVPWCSIAIAWRPPCRPWSIIPNTVGSDARPPRGRAGDPPDSGCDEDRKRAQRATALSKYNRTTSSAVPTKPRDPPVATTPRVQHILGSESLAGVSGDQDKIKLSSRVLRFCEEPEGLTGEAALASVARSCGHRFASVIEDGARAGDRATRSLCLRYLTGASLIDLGRV
ncbi:hypothetical protein B2J93_54 [Marssonina coronariae]|uniref:Uncharacterized protein n=1 Tax=Diplocarpon coronariae TaxID=2795749 RepID=A0A218Z3D1_9HELO|nr:hypothetical protein B2J93_54 [Marssonina coronariae]